MLQKSAGMGITLDAVALDQSYALRDGLAEPISLIPTDADDQPSSAA